MEIPKLLREQLKFYERHGFHAASVEPREGSHMKVIFAEFSQPQIVTRSKTDWRAWRNNLSRFRNLVKEKENEH